MLQLSNICVEWIQTWRNYNTFWEGIPLHNSQRKEGVFIGTLASVDLTKCLWMAVPGYPMSGLVILGKGQVHKAMHNFVKEMEMFASPTGATMKWCWLFWCNHSWSTGLHIFEPFQSYGYTAGCGGSHIAEAPAGDGQGFAMSFLRFWGDLVFRLSSRLFNGGMSYLG